MVKVNDFERDLDKKEFYDVLTNERANIEYRYDGDIETLLTRDLHAFLSSHIQDQRPRLETLRSYYSAKTQNLTQKGTRRLEKTKADHRIAHDYGRYITDFINGYFQGTPIKYDFDDSADNKKAQDFIDEIHEINDIESLNKSLGLDLSIYGRAYEIVFKNEENEIRTYKLDATNTFIIYDNSIENRSIAGVHYYETQALEDTEDTFYNVDVYTTKAIYKFKTSESTQYKLVERDTAEHNLTNNVQITEYRNNEFRLGDFENVITLIDLIDSAQSDTANYMTDLNDAMLLLIGNFELSAEAGKLQKEANIMHLIPATYEDDDGKRTEGKADGRYIYKQYDVSGAEAYKTRIDNNIHMFTHTPNMNDEHFSGTTSGEAMKYKLNGLEQRTAVKEGLFRKGLRRRYKLIDELASLNGTKFSTELKRINFIFTRNLPKSLLEEMEIYLKAGGEVSQQTLSTLVSFIPNYEEEKARLEAERDERAPSTDYTAITENE